MEIFLVLFALLLWASMGLGSALIASSRGASELYWFVVGFMLGPLGLLMAFYSTGKTCPICKSQIHKRAIVCPQCNKPLGGIRPTLNRWIWQLGFWLVVLLGVGSLGYSLGLLLK